MSSPRNYDNICISENPVFSVYYSIFLFNICMSIHPMTKVTDVLDLLHKKLNKCPSNYLFLEAIAFYIWNKNRVEDINIQKSDN